MSKLCIDFRLDRPDEFYEELIAMHDGLDAEQSRLADARLVLLLANQVGDTSVVREAIALARSSLVPGPGKQGR